MNLQEPHRGSNFAGNGAAIDWTAALAEHQCWMRTVVRSRIRDTDAADDVMQEIAVAVLKQNTRPLDPQKVPAWLYRVALRQTVNYRRRLGRQHRTLAAYASESAANERQAVNPRDWVLGQELRQSVADALDRLQPRDRQILLLKYTEGWSYQQLAEHLGITVKTVEYRLLRARRALRGHLRQFAEGEQA
jgi:RNA polymerase sigma-70 factor (ECF subfamily)